MSIQYSLQQEWERFSSSFLIMTNTIQSMGKTSTKMPTGKIYKQIHMLQKLHTNSIALPRGKNKPATERWDGIGMPLGFRKMDQHQLMERLWHTCSLALLLHGTQKRNAISLLSSKPVTCVKVMLPFHQGYQDNHQHLCKGWTPVRTLLPSYMLACSNEK